MKSVKFMITITLISLVESTKIQRNFSKLYKNLNETMVKEDEFALKNKTLSIKYQTKL